MANLDGTDRNPLADALTNAETATTLKEWGADDTWQVGLSRLLQAAAEDPHPAVRSGVGEVAAGLLATRLHLAADEVAHPEIVTSGVERPVVIVGLPRTGTTHLHALLALDPDARAPLAWEAAAPWPAPDLASYDSDPRIQAVQAGLDALIAARPEIVTMHDWGAQLPAECNEITMLHFASANFWARFGIPRYTDWLAEERPVGKYRTHQRVLQQLQWKGPRGRWTLKSPEHLFDLPALLATYPDACLVWTHREPAQVLSSLASLAFTVRSMFLPDVDRAVVGASVRTLWGAALERGTGDRQHVDVDKACLDVAYERLVAEPIAVVRAIYDHFELPYTTAYERRLRAHLDQPDKPQARPKHTYRPEDFGLSKNDLAEAFPIYRERFSALLGH
jgi:Sulfotransferase family